MAFPTSTNRYTLAHGHSAIIIRPLPYQRLSHLGSLFCWLVNFGLSIAIHETSTTIPSRGQLLQTAGLRSTFLGFSGPEPCMPIVPPHHSGFYPSMHRTIAAAV
jgi:hypothetical protein